MTPLVAGRIAAVGPSGAWQPERLQTGLERARGLGLDIELVSELHPDLWRSAPAAQRAADLVRAFTDPRYDAVWAIRGGEGLLGLLPTLPFSTFRPIPWIGFSDATALGLALTRHGLGPFVHAPVLHSLPTTDDASIAALADLLRGAPPSPWLGCPIVPGVAEGPLVGGNLSLFASLVGTPWAAPTRGAVVLLEDVGEPGYRLSRQLTQLRLAGTFDGVAGIVFGTFTDLRGTDEATLHALLREATEGLGVPVARGMPVGHGPTNHPFVTGRRVHLDGGTLRFVEPPTRVAAR